MLMKRTCRAIAASGQPCRAAPMTDSDYCFMHDPTMAKERAGARRLGGLRRRREKATSEIYDWTGLKDVPEVRRLLEVAVMDTLGLDNSPARSRTLGYLASLSLRAMEIGELEERVAALEELLEVGRLGGAGKRV